MRLNGVNEVLGASGSSQLVNGLAIDHIFHCFLKLILKWRVLNIWYFRVLIKVHNLV